MDLASRPRRLPPPNTPPALLSDGFVVTASAEEAAILAGRLGVPLLGQHEFVETHLLPHASALPAGPRDRAVASVLRTLHELPETLQAKLPTVSSWELFYFLQVRKADYDRSAGYSICRRAGRPERVARATAAAAARGWELSAWVILRDLMWQDCGSCIQLCDLHGYQSQLCPSI